MKINNQLLLSIFLTITIIFFSACSTKFNPHNRTIGYAGGEPFRVPQGVFFSTITEKNVAIIELCKKYNFTQTKLGDATWIELSYYEKSKNLVTDEQWLNWWKYGFEHSLTGCVSKMSDREYKYYTSKDRQSSQFKHEQNIQSQKNLNESLNNLPKTYNINVHSY